MWYAKGVHFNFHNFFFDDRNRIPGFAFFLFSLIRCHPQPPYPTSSHRSTSSFAKFCDLWKFNSATFSPLTIPSFSIYYCLKSLRITRPIYSPNLHFFIIRIFKKMPLTSRLPYNFLYLCRRYGKEKLFFWRIFFSLKKINYNLNLVLLINQHDTSWLASTSFLHKFHELQLTTYCIKRFYSLILAVLSIRKINFASF